MNTFTTHNNDETISVHMTHLLGHLTKPRHELVAMFGEPMIGSDDGKVVCEWNIEITDENGDMGVVTIYDWKNYSNAAMDDNYQDWNVGGHTGMALSVLHETIEQLEAK